MRRSARILNVPIDDVAASGSRGDRVAPARREPVVRRVRDYAEVRAGVITLDVAQAGADAARGGPARARRRADRRVLRTIIDKFGGGPVGLGTIAAAISEEKDAIEDIYEPFLIQIGFLDRTPRGRVATARAYDYFGLTAPGRDSRLW
jgi:Holliday junction DNA helicase RuvB